MYLITVTDGTRCQNKLHKAIAELLHKQNRRLLTELEATKFRDDLMEHLQGLNEKHAKCKPVSCFWWPTNPYKQTHSDWLLLMVNNTFIDVRIIYCKQDT